MNIFTLALGAAIVYGVYQATKPSEAIKPTGGTVATKEKNPFEAIGLSRTDIERIWATGSDADIEAIERRLEAAGWTEEEFVAWYERNR